MSKAAFLLHYPQKQMTILTNPAHNAFQEGLL